MSAVSIFLISATSARKEWELCELSGMNSLKADVYNKQANKQQGKQAQNMGKMKQKSW